jgi:hypothetical protein
MFSKQTKNIKVTTISMKTAGQNFKINQDGA